jgi:hypothetical protein
MNLHKAGNDLRGAGASDGWMIEIRSDVSGSASACVTKRFSPKELSADSARKNASLRADPPVKKDRRTFACERKEGEGKVDSRFSSLWGSHLLSPRLVEAMDEM